MKGDEKKVIANYQLIGLFSLTWFIVVGAI